MAIADPDLTPGVRALIERLRLEPHPEGGYYRELYRSEQRVQPLDGRPQRSAATTIFFLLAAGQHSRWHRVRSDEVWHFYAGDPLDLHVASESLDAIERVTLSGLDGPGHLVHVVPAGKWQSAKPRGEYSLVGCTVAPGFDFADFSFLENEGGIISP
jgi:predicted cupin superfamily sugar epimerase